MNLKNSYRSALILLVLGIPSLCSSSELLIFDNDNLIALESNGQLYGYYGAVEKNKSCMFLFVGHSLSVEDVGATPMIEKIKTFGFELGKYSYIDRYKPADIDGTITITGGEWIVQTEEEPPGCGGSVGVFHSSPFNSHQFRYNVTTKISALSIRIATKKSSFFKRKNKLLLKTKSYITEGDVVAVLKQEGGFSYIRYTDPDYFTPISQRVTTGWIRTSDLEDPFPPSQKQ